MPDNCYPTIIPTIDNSELECCELIKSQCVTHADELPTLSLPEDSDLRTILNEIDTYLSSIGGGENNTVEFGSSDDNPDPNASADAALFVTEEGSTKMLFWEAITPESYDPIEEVMIPASSKQYWFNRDSELWVEMASGSPTGLERRDSNGYRFIGRTGTQYVEPGIEAVDMTYQEQWGASRGATGNFSFAAGYTANASGNFSVAIGYGSNVTGNESYAIGRLNTVSAAYGYAVGSSNNVSSDALMALGAGNNISGFSSVALGAGNTINAIQGYAFGDQNNVTGSAGFAVGTLNVVSGQRSIALGYNNFARGRGEVSVGYLGTDYTLGTVEENRIFNVGIGNNTSDRKNAFTIFKNGSSLFVPLDKSTVSNGTKGMYIYDSVDDEPKYHDGTNWNSFGGSGSGEVNTYSDLGAGEGITGIKTGVDLPFKSLLGGTNITLTSDANTITISTDEGQIEETASFILSDATHNNKVVIVNNGATNITITVNTSLSNNFRAGFVQHGTGTVTFVASGTTLRSANGLIIDGQYNQAFIQKRNAGTNEFHVLGNLTT